MLLFLDSKNMNPIICLYDTYNLMFDSIFYLWQLWKRKSLLLLFWEPLKRKLRHFRPFVGAQEDCWAPCQIYCTFQWRQNCIVHPMVSGRLILSSEKPWRRILSTQVHPAKYWFTMQLISFWHDATLPHCVWALLTAATACTNPHCINPIDNKRNSHIA